jgi:predicted GIY-YIG superfamily endonuclease
MTSIAAQHSCVCVAGARAARRTTANSAHPKHRVHKISSSFKQRNWVRTQAAAEGTAAAAAAADPAEVYAIREAADDGTAVVSAAAWVEAREGPEPCAGVYAIYDSSENMQYVGYTKDAVSAVTRHKEGVGEERASKVRVAVFANKAMATRANLRAEADRWIGEWVERNGGEDSAVPPGKAEGVGYHEFAFHPPPASHSHCCGWMPRCKTPRPCTNPPSYDG